MTDASAATALATRRAGPALSAHKLVKRYGAAVAVDGLDLEVRRGTIFGLLGRNGAGKTTTLAMVATLLRPTSGELRVLGLDPVQQPREVRSAIGYMPDEPGLYDGTTVAEDLAFFAVAQGVPDGDVAERIEALIPAIGLVDQRHADCRSLSRGLRQRLALGRALVHDPDLVVLDEPANGLDPAARAQLRRLLAALRDQGRTVVISSHILAELEDLCDEVAIVDRGRVVAAGPPRRIRDADAGPRAVRVRLAGGAERIVHVADEAAQRALLRRLTVDDDLPVVEFGRVGGGLEEQFLRLTEDDHQ